MSDGRARSRADQDAGLVQAPASGGWAGKGSTAARVYAAVQRSPMSSVERAARPARRESFAPSSEEMGRALCPHLYLQAKTSDGAPAAEPEPAGGGAAAA
jgi:hypothetical protein